jgi:hypothetical protein
MSNGEVYLFVDQIADQFDQPGNCSGASRKEMAYELDAYIGYSGLSRAAREARRKFCAPCPVQEACLAAALIVEDLDDGMVGGLVPHEREALDEHYQSSTKTIALPLWERVTDAIIDGAPSVFPNVTKRKHFPKALAESRIVSYLASLPNYTLEAVDTSIRLPELFEKLARQTDIPSGTLPTVILQLKKQGRLVTRARDERQIRLVA